MKIKITHTHLIKLSETLHFTGKGTYVQKQKRLLKLDQAFSFTYQKHNKKAKAISSLLKNPNFG